MWRKKLLGRLCWPPSVSAACQGFLPSSANMMASKLRHHTIAAVMKKKQIWKWKMDWLNCAEQFSRCWNAPSQVYRKACWNLIRGLYNYIDYISGRRCSRHGCSGYWRLSCIVQPRPNTQAIIGGMWPLTAVFQSRIIVEFAIIISFMMFCCWFRVDDHLSCFPVVSKVASMAWHPRLTSVWLRDTEGNCEANRTGARCNMDPTVPLNPWLGVSDLFDVF